MCVGWLVENKAQILERVRPNSSQFNLAQQFILAVFSMWTLVVFIWRMGHSSVHLHVSFFKLRIVQNYSQQSVTISLLRLCSFDFSQDDYFCAQVAFLWFSRRAHGRSRWLCLASSRAEVVDSALRVLGKLVQTFTGEKLVGHTGQRQPGFKAYARQHQTQCASRSGLSLKHAKSFTILTAFAQKNAASKPYHSYYAHSPTARPTQGFDTPGSIDVVRSAFGTIPTQEANTNDIK
jgi:hypothetical protein